MRMTPERLAAAKERCEAATPGEWYAINGGRGGDSDAALCLGEALATAYFPRDGHYLNAPADANFCAAARTDLPDALADLEELAPVAALVPLLVAWRKAHYEAEALAHSTPHWDEVGWEAVYPLQDAEEACAEAVLVALAALDTEAQHD